MKRTASLILLLLCGLGAMAHDYVPGPPQDHPILLRGGDLYTVSGGILKATDLLFDNGRITQIGRDLTPPDKCEIIDCSGLRIYPGLIIASSPLGLIEIGAVRATNDQAEVGSVRPEVVAHIAYNPESELIPTIRSMGITTALSEPQGGLVAGRSSLMNLDGWTKEDAAAKLEVGLHVNWPTWRTVDAWWMTDSPEQQRRNNEKQRKQLHDVFSAARAYHLSRQAGIQATVDLRYEAMRPVFTKELPVIIRADNAKDIEDAADFAHEFGVRMILAGGDEAYLRASLLRRYSIPVIYGPMFNLPSREDDDYDQPFRAPARLRDSGLTFCIAPFSSWDSRNLPFQAGYAAAFGSSQDEALRAVTLSPAEILGVSSDLGSLETGKLATLIICRGDVLDFRSHGVMRMFIAGRPVDLNNRQSEFYHKYQQKPRLGR